MALPEMVQANEGGVPEGTPAEGVAPVATPTTPPTDATQGTTDVDAIRQKYEADLAATRNDMNKLKSSLQSNQARAEREWQTRQKQYEAEIEQLRLRGMDEGQRKEYEASAQTRRMQELAQQAQQAQEQAESNAAMLRAHNYFIAQGVPADQLDVENGYESLWESGMGYMTSEYQRLRQLELRPSTPVTPVVPQKPVINAPAVVTQTNTPAFGGNTWEDMVKRFGSEEAVYKAFESGQLPPEAIPGNRG